MKNRLGHYPTPLVALRRLSEILGGPEIWMKRDDLTGLAFGGNKTRKLEYFIEEALTANADVVITAGAQQSNHCRQTAAACAAVGLECHLVLGGTEPPAANGNFLLDRLLHARIHLMGAERKGESLGRIHEDLRRQGRRPYLIPYGGSNAIGARGFVDAVGELHSQLSENAIRFDRIVFASSSGGTQAGLLVGARIHDLGAQALGITIDKEEAGALPFDQHICNIANELKAFCPYEGEIAPTDVCLCNDYTGAGYGIVGALEREAISLVAAAEGILLDPVYTGRTAGALIDMVRRGRIGKEETVLFWHTGGTPALFSYAAELGNLK